MKGMELAALNQEFAILDFALIIPGAVGSLLTGFLICKTTSWGFIRYRWVIVKWAGTLFGILVGSALLGPWQLQMVSLTNQAEAALAASSPYHPIRFLFTLTGFLQVVLLIFIVTLSVVKPWGKRFIQQKDRNPLEQQADAFVQS